MSRPRRRVRRAVSTAAALGMLITATGSLLALPAAAATPVTARTTAADDRGAAGLDSALSADQASARARETGKAVVATGETTVDSTLTANANGTFTLDESLVPVRKRVGDAWKPLNATLVKNLDGSISTAVTSSDLSLSAGGGGPLATMDSLGRRLAVSLPVRLPAPVLSGDTATYRNVLSGVDLTVTANTQGSFSEVLVVKNAKAAANPALKSLTLAVRATGVRLSSDAAGNITARTPSGQSVFTAPIPRMWDSSTATAPTAAASAAKGKTDATSAARAAAVAAAVLPADSTTAGPGRGAHTAAIGVRTTAAGIVLTPAASLLTGPGVKYPVYVDPTFNSPNAGGKLQAWTQINSYYADQSYWESSDNLRVGLNDWTPPYFTAESFVQMSIPSQIYGSTVSSAQFNITEVDSSTCATAYPVKLYESNSKISSATTWDSNRPNLSSLLTTTNADYGYTGCPAHGVPFNIQSYIQSVANAGTTKSVVLGLVTDETDENAYKEFDHDTASLSITYDHTPDVPSNLHTSPASTCSGASYVGDGDVWLYSTLTDPDNGPVGATFHVYVDGTSTLVVPDTNPQSLNGQSGGALPLKLPKATLEKLAAGKLLKVDWTVTATDFNVSSKPTSVCSFTFDSTRPSAPTITPPADKASTVAAQTTATITPACASDNSCTTSNTPATYQWQLNGGPPNTVTATNGVATITFAPTRRTNVLTAMSQSPAGNFGYEGSSVPFIANAAAPAADSDLSGDGVPDLVTVGGQNGIPSGLWQATGQGSQPAYLVPSAVDIGANGNGYTGDDSPADFNGAQAVTGQFDGPGLQDVLVYYPSGANAGGGSILYGNGDGSVLSSQLSGNEATINADDTFFQDINTGDNALQIANAGNTSGDGSGYPDIIGTSGDATNGYVLNLYPAMQGVGTWNTNTTLQTTLAGGTVGNVPTPDGTQDWNDWTIATCQMPDGNGTSTDMYLWNKTTGAVDLWENLAVSPTTGLFSYTPYQIQASGFLTNQAETLQASDINGDGIPDLWAVGNGGVVTALVTTVLPSSGTTGTGGSTGTVTDTLLTATDNWALDGNTPGGTPPAPDTAITTAADSTGSKPLTATTTAGTWNTGDMFSPDANLAGTGQLATTGYVVDPSTDFSVSAWVEPTTLGGYVLGQDASKSSSFTLYSDAASKTWRFEMPTTDVATPTENVVTSGSIPAQTGIWTHLTATYQASSKTMSLYVDGILAGTATHTPVAFATKGPFTVGAYQANGASTSYFTGQVARVQSWTRYLTTAQIGAMANLAPAPSEMQVTALLGPNDYLTHSTRNSAGVWSTPDQPADMFYNPSGVNSVTTAEFQGTTYLAAYGPGVLEFLERPFDSTQWVSPTSVNDPLNGAAVPVVSVNASAIVDGNFELLGLDASGNLWDIVRQPNGVWSNWTNLSSSIGGSIGAITDVAAATTTGGDLQVVAVAGGKPWHSLRSTAGGSWTTWGNVETATGNNPGTVTHVSAAGVQGNLQVMVSTSTSLWHAIRTDSTGEWTVFGEASATPNIVSIAMASVGTGPNNVMMVVYLDSSGTITHRIRNTDSTWGTAGNATTYVTGGTSNGTALQVSATGD
ncbi:LamG-like jellyroll fold domain-containing protein [Streptacidiphilus sp. P02-A3a]|uniref:LamG-like jellyroll fold domain-containing protein n=1 Tax=Streptacidiphilus sp. P02-A3a TaxID=2704468 RepID=UPI0015F9EE2E|nr:LamG-like jellyroll fold domain-containing protein [Streptacidiphilus sp. P02-A3a]QMU70623.1 LamG domain-containing protein [Streptacidiphilus sp. P02-A3a]